MTLIIRTSTSSGLIALATLAVLACPLSGQEHGVRVQFSRSYGGPGEETGNVIVAMRAGGYLVAGYSTIDTVDHEFLVRVDSAGDTLWTRTSDEPAEDPAWDAVTDSAGAVTLVGYTTGHSAIGEDALLTRLSSSGEVEWRRTLGGTGDQLAWGMSGCPNGDFILAGQTRLNSSLPWSGWIARVSSAGARRWMRTVEGDAEIRFFGAAADERGGAIVAGSRRDRHGIRHAFVVAVDPLGRIVWQKELEAGGATVAHQIIRDQHGTLIITGYGDADETATPSQSVARTIREQPIYWRISPQGQVRHTTRAPGTADERAIASAPRMGGGFWSVGYRRVRGEEDWDIVLSAWDDARVEWSRTFGGPAPDRGVALLPRPDGTILLTGSQNNGAGRGNDLVLIKLAPAP